jgi:hypothetical protein
MFQIPWYLIGIFTLFIVYYLLLVPVTPRSAVRRIEREIFRRLGGKNRWGAASRSCQTVFPIFIFSLAHLSLLVSTS